MYTASYADQTSLRLQFCRKGKQQSCLRLQLRLISDSPERLGMLLASVAGQDVIVDVDEPSTSR